MTNEGAEALAKSVVEGTVREASTTNIFTLREHRPPLASDSSHPMLPKPQSPDHGGLTVVRPVRSSSRPPPRSPLFLASQRTLLAAARLPPETIAAL